MKIQKMCEFASCDVCGDEKQVYYHCAACGKDFCYEHRNNIVAYHQRIGTSGYGDIELCLPCDAVPPLEMLPVLDAYKAVKRLKVESDSFWQGFREREKVAEERAGTLFEEFKRGKK